MPASLYPTVSNPAAAMVHVGSNGTNASDLISSMMNQENNSNFDQVDSRAAAEQIALQLALLQQGDHHHGHGHHHQHHHPSSNGVSSGSQGGHHQQHGQHHGQHHHGGQIIPNSSSDLLNGHGAGHSGSLEDLKSSTQRRSQNMTECVPVPSSEHVAEIVGRQGRDGIKHGVVLIKGYYRSVSQGSTLLRTELVFLKKAAYSSRTTCSRRF